MRVSDLPKSNKAMVWKDIQTNNPGYAEFLTHDDGIQAIRDQFGSSVSLSVPATALTSEALETIPAGFFYSVNEDAFTEESHVFGPAWCRASPLK